MGNISSLSNKMVVCTEKIAAGVQRVQSNVLHGDMAELECTEYVTLNVLILLCADRMVTKSGEKG